MTTLTPSGNATTEHTTNEALFVAKSFNLTAGTVGLKHGKKECSASGKKYNLRHKQTTMKRSACQRRNLTDHRKVHTPEEEQEPPVYKWYHCRACSPRHSIVQMSKWKVGTSYASRLIRMCVDPRDLNKAIQWPHYPIIITLKSPNQILQTVENNSLLGCQLNHQIKQTLHILHQYHHFQTKHTKTNNTQTMQKVDQPDQKWSLGRTCGPNSGLLPLARFKVRISGAPTSTAGTTTGHYRPPHWHSQSTK